MPDETLEKYIKEFGDHLRGLDYSKCTVNGYTMSVKQLLCNVVDDRSRDKIYNLKYTPKTLTLEYLKEYSKRVKDNLEPHTQRMKLMGVKYYLRYIKATYKSELYDEYENEKTLYGSKKDILRPRPIQDTHKDPLSEKEIMDFFKISKHNPRNHAILKMFLYTTQRIHSIVNLNVSDIDFNPIDNKNGEIYYNITIRYRKGINKPPIDIPVPEDVIKAVSKYLEDREEPKQDGYILDNYGRKLYHKDALFLNGWGQRFKGIGMYQMMKRYSVELGIKKPIHPHLWRHTAITLMDKKGMTEGEIKRISGHSKLSNAIKTYINPREEDIISKSQKALSMQPTQPIQSKPIEETKPIPDNRDEIINKLLKRVEELENSTRGYQ